LDHVIEVDTKALRHGLMSGETLRAPRQQLRLLRCLGPLFLPSILQRNRDWCSHSYPNLPYLRRVCLV